MYARKPVFPRAPLLILTLMILTLTIPPLSAISARDAQIALTSEPGTTLTFPVILSLLPNEHEGDVTVDVRGLGQSAPDGNYTALPAEADTSPFSARPLITLDTPTVHLVPGRQAEITATVTVPHAMNGGGRYAMLVVRPAENPAGLVAGAGQEVSIPVLITVTGGTVRETGEITALAFSTPDFGNELLVSTMFRNTGNHHYAGIQSIVTITDNRGRILARSSGQPSAFALLPGQEVSLGTSFEHGMPEGAHTIITRVEKQDGTSLAEITECLGDPQEPAGTPPGQADGFSLYTAVLAVAGGIYGVRRALSGS